MNIGRLGCAAGRVEFACYKAARTYSRCLESQIMTPSIQELSIAAGEMFGDEFWRGLETLIQTDPSSLRLFRFRMLFLVSALHLHI